MYLFRGCVSGGGGDLKVKVDSFQSGAEMTPLWDRAGVPYGAASPRLKFRRRRRAHLFPSEAVR